MNWDQLGVAVFGFATVGLFRLAWLMFRRRPGSVLVPALYVLGFGSAVVTTVLLGIPLLHDPSWIDVFVAAGWLAVLWLLIRVVQAHARLMATLRAGLLVPWTAMLAPIGAPSQDGRILLAGQWNVQPGGAPLWTDVEGCSPYNRKIIGLVHRVWLDGEHLMGAGVVLAGARLDGLVPEVSITPHRAADYMAGRLLADNPDNVFPAGIVNAVRMGRQPAFSGVWLKLDRKTP